MGRLNTSNQISGQTYKDIHIFIDEYGNVTQTEKKVKERLKYYVDPNLPQADYAIECVIGISDSANGDCTYGIGLGIGDNTYAAAIY